MISGRRDFFAPPTPLSFLLPIAHPLGRTFFLSPVFHCMKNSRWRLNIFIRCERLNENISPALQAINFPTLAFGKKTEKIMVSTGFEPVTSAIPVRCFSICGFIAQLVEHRTCMAKVTGSNPVEAMILSGFFPIAEEKDFKVIQAVATDRLIDVKKIASLTRLSRLEMKTAIAWHYRTKISLAPK